MTLDRRQLARLGAPAAFLLGVTIALLLVRSGLEGGAAVTRTSTLGPVTHAPATTIPTIAATAPVPQARTTTAATSSTAALSATATGATTATTAATDTTATVAGAQYYTVAKGDTFGSIARKAGTSVAQIETLNPGVSSSALQVGQKLRIK